jgi:NAD+ kinase
MSESAAIRRFGLAYNPTSEPAIELRERVAGWCTARGFDHWAAPAGATDDLAARLPETDALVVLGGDGTLLLAAQAVARVDTPLLGVNLGKVGFLSQVEAHEVEAVLGRVAAGGYRIEERMALRGAVHPGGRPGGSGSFVALNDVVVARGALARVVRLEVDIGRSHLATFIADGLVVSSPTGSTGYSFSAGGPVVDPLSRNLIVTPIAGYLSAIRSVVVSSRRTIRIVIAEAHEALVSIDGREDRPVVAGDAVTVAALERSIRFIVPDGAIPFWDLFRRKVELLPS